MEKSSSYVYSQWCTVYRTHLYQGSWTEFWGIAPIVCWWSPGDVCVHVDLTVHLKKESIWNFLTDTVQIWTTGFKLVPFIFFSCLVKANRGEGQQEKIKCILAYLAQVVESMPQGRFQCCVSVSGSGLDHYPDPTWISIRIRLGSGFNCFPGSRSRRTEITHKNWNSS